MDNLKGRVTIPTDANIVEETLNIMQRWGADAVRDCDGTALPEKIKSIADKVYTTYFPSRGDHAWANSHPEELQQLYLMSEFRTAEGDTLVIDPLRGYFEQQVKLDTRHDVKKWWEVIDRTTGEAVSPDDWTFNKDSGLVTICRAVPFHEYTVSFLVYAIWDPTQMYNYITNNWDREKEKPYDVRQPKTRVHILETLEKWLAENPDTDVVRFTTFYYHFTLLFNQMAKEKYVDWFGYGTSVSPLAIEDFEREKGYRLRPEDFVDEGYYNSSFRVPSKAYLDYVDFLSRFVCRQAKECVERVHAAGKEAMMFLGDNWIGTEPYGRYFSSIGMDAVVGSVGSGATLRLISEIPGVKYTEGRFLPYFFPDVFHEGGDPISEARENWITARRAILRKPVDRIGYGGYLKLAVQFPDFVGYIEKVCDEFRTLYANIDGHKPYTAPFKVAVLNCWGRLRSWSTHMVAHALWYKQIYSYLGVLEALSGMAVDVVFLSFDDLLQDGHALDNIGVVINAGDAYTAFSGGERWADEKVVAMLRRFVHGGGGLIGVGEPSAYQKEGHYFQLATVLGVDEERGFSLSTRKYGQQEHEHFITEDFAKKKGGQWNFGEGMKNVYVLPGAQALVNSGGDVQLAVNQFGNGRSVYISGLPYNADNTRLLMRSIFWAASREREMKRWYAENPETECHAYPESGKFAVVNNGYIAQDTTVHLGDGKTRRVHLDACEIRWFPIDDTNDHQ